jgi:hypothetical protein
MSLTWDLQNIKDYKTVCWIETGEKDDKGEPVTRLNPVTNTLIWMTMAVKLGSITEANAADFYGRLRIMEKLDGPFLYKIENGEKIDRYFTPEEIHAHIGLVCNVTSESFSKFLGVVRDDHKQFKAHYTREIKKDSVVS